MFDLDFVHFLLLQISLQCNMNHIMTRYDWGKPKYMTFPRTEGERQQEHTLAYVSQMVKMPPPPTQRTKKKTVIVATWSCTTRDNRIQNMPFEGLETLFFFFKERRWNTCVWTFRLLCNSLTLSAKATWTMLDQIPSLHWHHSVTTKKKQTACV